MTADLILRSWRYKLLHLILLDSATGAQRTSSEDIRILAQPARLTSRPLSGCQILSVSSVLKSASSLVKVLPRAVLQVRSAQFVTKP
jgi:hypothetical protein